MKTALKASEVAKVLGYSKRQVLRWIDEGVFPGVYWEKNGWLVPVKEVDQKYQELQAENKTKKPKANLPT